MHRVGHGLHGKRQLVECIFNGYREKRDDDEFDLAMNGGV